MLVKELIASLEKMNPDSLISLDTFEGISLLDIDQIYTDEEGVVLYGSVMNLTQSRGTSKIPPLFITSIREAFYNNNDEIKENTPALDVESCKVGDTARAIEIIRKTGSASATLLERSLGIDYPQAQNLIDLLEANGVIGPADGAKPRKVFLKA